MATAIRHEACPQCRKDGHDNSGDNLAVYSDGGAYCFRCGYYILSQKKLDSNELRRRNPRGEPQLGPTVFLPEDISRDFPEEAKDYFKKYALTGLDIAKNNICWSDSRKRIIFPYIVGGELVAWQGRLPLDNGPKKWYTQGVVNDLYYIVGNVKAPTIVLVEDIVSAIRVGNHPNVCAMPLFGSIISTRQMLVLADRYFQLVFWLDKDREEYSQERARRAREYGINCISLVTDQDPKAYSNKEVRDHLTKVEIYDNKLVYSGEKNEIS